MLGLAFKCDLNTHLYRTIYLYIFFFFQSGTKKASQWRTLEEVSEVGSEHAEEVLVVPQGAGAAAVVAVEAAVRKPKKNGRL